MDIQYPASFFGISAIFLSEMEIGPIFDRVNLGQRDLQQLIEIFEPMEIAIPSPSSASSVVVTDDNILVEPSPPVHAELLDVWIDRFHVFTNAPSVVKEDVIKTGAIDCKCVVVLSDGRRCGLKR